MFKILSSMQRCRVHFFSQLLLQTIEMNEKTYNFYFIFLSYLPLRSNFRKKNKTNCHSQASCLKEQFKFHVEQNEIPKE